MATESYDFDTLPDYLAPGLDLVLIGINPGLYSAQRGHYFARSTSRFWPTFAQSILSARVRRGLGRDVLSPEDDAALLRFGIGFTDVVKVPGRNAAVLRPADYAMWAPHLLARLEKSGPRVAAFHGLTGYRAFARYALNLPDGTYDLGPQDVSIGEIRLFVVPNPSPANAHFRAADYVFWYDQLAKYLEDAVSPSGPG